MQRKNDESFEDYKARRARVNRLTKGYCQGWLIWDSSKNGTVSDIQLLNRSLEAEKSMKGFFSGEEF